MDEDKKFSDLLHDGAIVKAITQKEKDELDAFERYMAESEAKLDKAMKRNGIDNYPTSVRCPVVDKYEALPNKRRTDAFDASRYMLGKDGFVKPNTNAPQAAPEVDVANDTINGVPREDYLDPYGYGSQFTLDDYQRMHRKDLSTAASSGTCYHDWKLYQGLLHDDYYCTKCNVTKPIPKD